MPKLLRSRKQFGRCSVAGHGQNHVHINGEGTRYDCCCEVVDDIQTTPFTRAQDKREALEEIKIGIQEAA